MLIKDHCIIDHNNLHIEADYMKCFGVKIAKLQFQLLKTNIIVKCQTAEYGSFWQFGCGEGTRCAKQLPSADH